MADTEKKTGKDGRKLPERKQYADATARFKGIAADRTLRAEADILLIGNCSNPQNYTYTKDQVATIITRLRAAVDKVEAQFANPNQPKGTPTLDL